MRVTDHVNPAAPDEQPLMVLVELESYTHVSRRAAAAREALRNIRFSMNRRARVYLPLPAHAPRPKNAHTIVRHGSVWVEIEPQEGDA